MVRRDDKDDLFTQVIIDGRGVLKRENFAGIAFFRIGDGE